MFDPNEQEPLSPDHARDELLCGLLREAMASYDAGTKLMVWTILGRQEVSAMRLRREWYEQAKDAVGD